MQPKKLPQIEWLIAILITAAAIALHFFSWLHVGSLWCDEANLINVSQRHSLVEMAKDSFPITMPLIVHAWLAVGLGQSDLTLRLLGLLIGLGVLAALWISSWRIRRAPPLVGLVLFSLNSVLITFGDSLRAYGLGSLCVVALATSAFLFLQAPSRKRAIWLVILATLSVQVLYNNAVLVAAICFGAWAVCWRRADKRAALQILIVAVISAASLLPYLHNFIANNDTSAALRVGASKFRYFSSYESVFDWPISGYRYDWILLGFVIVLCAITGFWQRPGTGAKAGNRFGDNDFTLFASVTILVATVAFPIFFWYARLPGASWYLLPYAAVVVVCFDAALPTFTGILRGIFLAFIVVTALISLPYTYASAKSHFSNMESCAQLLETDAAPDDYILVCPWHSGITFSYYFKGATPWETVPPLADHSAHRYDLVMQQMENTNALVPLFQKVSETLQSGHRVWIASDRDWIVIPQPGTPAPVTLPLPPLNYTGWAWSRYSEVWAGQTAHFLADHSAAFQQLPQTNSTETFGEENTKIFVARGWRTTQTPLTTYDKTTTYTGGRTNN
jgi:hypothetical protein